MIEKKIVEEEYCTWVFQEFLNNPKCLDMDKKRAEDDEIDGQLYYLNLQKCLFRIEQESQ